MKKIAFLFSLLFLTALAHAQDSVIGDWMFVYQDEEGTNHKTKISFTAEGDYSVDFGTDGQANVLGKYIMEGDKVTLWDVGGEFACPDQVKGTYQVKFEGETMHVVALEDPCEPRRGPAGTMTMTRM